MKQVTTTCLSSCQHNEHFERLREVNEKHARVRIGLIFLLILMLAHIRYIKLDVVYVTIIAIIVWEPLI